MDCDCDGHPHAPEMKENGILASLNLVQNHISTAGDDITALKERFTSNHGIHTIDYAAKFGLGFKNYKIIDIDNK